MKFKSLILFVVFAIFLISCDKDMKRVNPNDEGADLSEIAKICAQNNAECGYIETAIEGKMRSIFCGKCENGSCVSNKCEKNDDDTDTDTTPDTDTDTGSDDSDTATTPDKDADTATDDDTDTGSADTDTKSDEDTDTVPDDEPEPIDDDETPDADENPVADEDEIDDSDNGDPIMYDSDNGDPIWHPNDEDEIDDSDIISDPTLPECNSSTASFPCKDSSTGHIWSEMASGMEWQEANDHCTGLNSSNYGGYSSGWHLPTIDELRTLIQNCAATEPGGSCGVTESCLSSSCLDSSCYSCSSDSTGGHSKFGKTNELWSSSTLSDYDNALFVDFEGGGVYDYSELYNHYVRCVRNDGNENPEIPDDDETPDADENPVADEDEIDDSDNGDPIMYDPECNSSTTSFPCKDSSTGHIWSEMASGTMNWQAANDHCTGLNSSNYGGYSSGWHLPTIDELKTLLKWRRDSQCKVSDTDDCLSFTDCWTCSSCCHDCTPAGGGECNYSSYYYDGRYSELGDSGLLWSSSVPTEYSHSACMLRLRPLPLPVEYLTRTVL